MLPPWTVNCQSYFCSTNWFFDSSFPFTKLVVSISLHTHQVWLALKTNFVFVSEMCATLKAWAASSSHPAYQNRQYSSKFLFDLKIENLSLNDIILIFSKAIFPNVQLILDLLCTGLTWDLLGTSFVHILVFS